MNAAGRSGRGQHIIGLQQTITYTFEVMVEAVTVVADMLVSAAALGPLDGYWRR